MSSVSWSAHAKRNFIRIISTMPRYSTEAERAVIFALREEGKSWREIEQHPYVTLKKASIKKWARRGADEGLDPGLKTRPKTGRPKVTTPELDAEVLASVEALPMQGVAPVVREIFPEYPGCMETARNR